MTHKMKRFLYAKISQSREDVLSDMYQIDSDFENQMAKIQNVVYDELYLSIYPIIWTGDFDILQFMPIYFSENDIKEAFEFSKFTFTDKL